MSGATEAGRVDANAAGETASEGGTTSTQKKVFIGLAVLLGIGVLICIILACTGHFDAKPTATGTARPTGSIGPTGPTGTPTASQTASSTTGAPTVVPTGTASVTSLTPSALAAQAVAADAKAAEERAVQAAAEARAAKAAQAAAEERTAQAIADARTAQAAQAAAEERAVQAIRARDATSANAADIERAAQAAVEERTAKATADARAAQAAQAAAEERTAKAIADTRTAQAAQAAAEARAVQATADAKAVADAKAAADARAAQAAAQSAHRTPSPGTLQPAAIAISTTAGVGAYGDVAGPKLHTPAQANAQQWLVAERWSRAFHVESNTTNKINGIYTAFAHNGDIIWVSSKKEGPSMIAYNPTTSDVSIYTNKLEETVQLQGPVYTSKSLTIWGLLRPYRPHDASKPPRGICTLGSATVTFSNLNVDFGSSAGHRRDLHDVFIAKVDQNGIKCDIFLTTSGLPHIGGQLLASTHIIYTYDNGLVIYAELKPDKTWNILSPFPWDVGRMSQQVVRVDF